jgi:hypothetical protein
MSDKTQASGNHIPDRSSSSNLTKIVTEAYQDLNSQSRRILPNLGLLQGLLQTFLAGGIIVPGYGTCRLKGRCKSGEQQWALAGPSS